MSGKPVRLYRSTILRASSKGHALLVVASAMTSGARYIEPLGLSGIFACPVCSFGPGRAGDRHFLNALCANTVAVNAGFGRENDLFSIAGPPTHH
jgi:hypothetical protein